MGGVFWRFRRGGGWIDVDKNKGVLLLRRRLHRFLFRQKFGQHFVAWQNRCEVESLPPTVLPAGFINTKGQHVQAQGDAQSPDPARSEVSLQPRGRSCL